VTAGADEQAVLIRARDDLGQYVADDPATPTDEAWVEVPLADA
jgi:hypothetical protein